MTRALPPSERRRSSLKFWPAAGIAVRLSDDYTPTPALSYAVKNLGAAGGVMITSSHNPFNWNGVKYKAGYGGSGTPAIMKAIEGELDSPRLERKGGSVTLTDFKTPYIAAIKNFVDLKLIQKAGFKFAIDVMYGAGRGVLKGIFAESGIDHLEIRGELNPLFPGINPEPIPPHIAMLQETVVRDHCQAGLATDGDADRLGAVAEDGSFVDAHKCFCLILEWLLKRKQWPGEIVRAFNTTRMLDRIAAKYGRKLNECGIGFKYICDLMLERDILIGGEESGGIGITPASAGARWHSEFAAAGQHHGGRGQAAGPTGARPATGIRRASLWPPRSSPQQRGER